MVFPISDQERLKGFLDADPKYEIAPVPVPVDRAAAARAISDRVKPGIKARDLEKLGRLAVFYDLREAAASFGSVLKLDEKEAADYARSAQALIALAWIGDSAQWDYTQRYYRALLERADPERDRVPLLDACDALGPREGSEAYRRWVAGRLTKVERELAEAQQKRAPEAESLTNRRNTLREHLDGGVRDLDRDNAARLRIAGMPADARPQYLAPLYMRDPDLPGISEKLSDWAAMTLIRLAYQGGARERIVAAFGSLAAKHGGNPKLRARALRAAEFFGHRLDEATRAWVAEQPDGGVDPLAVRPSWKYGQ
jgi:hypothetical protein